MTKKETGRGATGSQKPRSQKKKKTSSECRKKPKEGKGSHSDVVSSCRNEKRGRKLHLRHKRGDSRGRGCRGERTLLEGLTAMRNPEETKEDKGAREGGWEKKIGSLGPWGEGNKPKERCRPTSLREFSKRWSLLTDFQKGFKKILIRDDHITFQNVRKEGTLLSNSDNARVRGRPRKKRKRRGLRKEKIVSEMRRQLNSRGS